MGYRHVYLCGLVSGLLLFAASVNGCGGGSETLFNSSSSSADASSGSSSGSSSGGGGASSSSSGMGGTGGGGTGCAAASDCDTKLGPAPCGAWACNAGVCDASSPGCTDADHDGYGTGQKCMCAGIDCDDANPMVGSTATTSCYSGPPNTMGKGVCQAGTQSCTAGVWTPCVGEVTPSAEACNNQDDNCDGKIDDNLGSFSCGLGVCAKSVPSCVNGVAQACVPGMPASNVDGPACDNLDSDCDGAVDEDCKSCIPVSLLGNDLTANGTFALPFQTIQAAINWAAGHAGPKTVCVAAGAACGVTGTYASAANATVTMANGVSVLGNYESINWTRCGAGTTTVIQPQTPAGVTFPASVNTATVLDGFRVDRFNSPSTSGITVDGATNAVISNINITNTPAVMTSYGVNVINGASAQITSKSKIDAGVGGVESIAIRSVKSKVTIQNNCLSLDAAGRCDDGCGNNPAIRGKITAGPGQSYGVYLEDSPNSLVESSAICANNGDQGAGVRIKGDGKGIVIHGNNINAFGGVQDSHGVWMEDCNDAAPWVVDNFNIAASGVNQQSRVDGVRAIGACHPVVDSNVVIRGGGEGNAANPNGVHCAANAAMVPSQCVVLGNKLIQGSGFGFPPVATGVRCDDKSCLRVANNVIDGRGGMVSYGVYLKAAGTFVDNNVISGGCSGQATGLYADTAFARVQNNRIFGFVQTSCGVGGVANVTQSYGMHVLASMGVNEIDVHSNDIDGGGAMGAAFACTSHGLTIDIGAMAPAGGSGIFRNNNIRAGACGTARYNVDEVNVAADPRIFEHNNLDPTGNPTALYFDEANKTIGTAAGVDMLVDMTVNGTQSVDPMYVNYPTDLHLQAGSMCIDKGTSTGAPSMDMDGKVRGPMPDIGADEF